MTTIQATPTQLKEGGWGLRVTVPANLSFPGQLVGKTVTVTTRRGKKSEERIERVLTDFKDMRTGDRIALCIGARGTGAPEETTAKLLREIIERLARIEDKLFEEDAPESSPGEHASKSGGAPWL